MNPNTIIWNVEKTQMCKNVSIIRVVYKFWLRTFAILSYVNRVSSARLRDENKDSFFKILFMWYLFFVFLF